MSEEASPRTRETIERELATKAWQDDAFMDELRSNPKAVIAREYGVQLPDSMNLKVVEEDASTLYLRIPPNPSNVELSDEQLELVAGGEVVVTAVIGVVGITVSVAVSSVTTSASITVAKGW